LNKTGCRIILYTTIIRPEEFAQASDVQRPQQGFQSADCRRDNGRRNDPLSNELNIKLTGILLKYYNDRFPYLDAENHVYHTDFCI